MRVHRPIAGCAILAAALVVLSGCAGLGLRSSHTVAPQPPATESSPEPDPEPPARFSGPASPVLAPPEDSAARDVWRAAIEAEGRRIVVSREDRWLWLMDGGIALFGAPVAVGRTETFHYQGKTFNYETPAGKRRVLDKVRNRLWVPPAWHYYEKAKREGLEIVWMERGERYTLSDGSYLVIRGNQVGRVSRFNDFYAWTPGMEIVFDGKLYVPPFGTAQRKIAEILGTHALELGDGYLIHGTPARESVGRAASHGCIRMYNEDVARLYGMVEVGTPVYIY